MDSTYTCYEKLNVANLKRLLKSETDTNKKTLLNKFAKSMDDKGVVKCSYKNKKYAGGRMYASPSLQGIDKLTRQIISVPAWDFDIVNAYPTILKNMCDTNGIAALAPLLIDYVAHREAWLKTGLTKDDMISSLFGSQQPTDSQKLEDFRKEIKQITLFLTSLPIYKDLAKAVKALKGDATKFGSVLSYIIQEEELKIMTKVFCNLEEKYPLVEVQSYIFDGFMVAKSDKVNPEALLDDINSWVAEFNVKFAIKPFECPGWPVEEVDINPFEEFQLTNLKICNPPCFIRETGLSIQILNKADLQTIYDNIPPLPYHLESFISSWRQYPGIRSYETMDLLPPPLVCSATTYNMWKGWQIDRVEGGSELMFLEHIQKLIPDVDESLWFVAWLAHIIQRPGNKTGICPMLIGRQGAGKGFLIEQMIKGLMGAYFFYSNDPANDLFGRFNEGLNRKLFVNIDDFNVGDMKINCEKFKSLITAVDVGYEGKNQKKVGNTNCTNFLISTNKSDPGKIDADDRRFAVIECSAELVGDFKYFEELDAYWSQPENRWAVFDFLMNADLSKVDLKRQRPIKSELYKDIKLSSADRELLFLASVVQGEKVEFRSNELFEMYTNWFRSSGFKSHPKDAIMFGIYVSNKNNVGAGVTKRRSNGTKYTLHKALLIPFLLGKGIPIENVCLFTDVE